MEFRILGPLEVWAGDRRIDLPRAKQRALLAALLVRDGAVASVDALVDDLWGETPPPAAIGSLQNLVSALRKALGPDVIRTQAPGYALDVDADAVDAHRFTRLVREARERDDAAERARFLREALGLWRGRPLADLAFEPFAEVEISRLEELRDSAREDLVDAELKLGRHASVIFELESLVADQPYRERPRALLMLALYRIGRQTDALNAFQEARRFLKSQGLEPSPVLKQLQQAILRQDQALDPPTTTLVPIGAEERRKTITVAFADLVDSTALSAKLDVEANRDVLRRWYRAAREVFERHDGSVEKFIGDAVVAVFGVPAQHEDDALRAVRAAVELADAVAVLNAELESQYGVVLRTRVGVNTGEAIAGEGDAAVSFATGHAVNVAAKLQQYAPTDAILVSAATYRLVRDAVTARPVEPLVIAGRPIPAFRMISVSPRRPAITRIFDTPLVGRTDEVAALYSAFHEVRDTASSRVVTVVGEPGIGKSRLAAELAAAVGGETTALVGRCVSYGAGATYLPLADVVRTLVPDGSESGIAALVGDEREGRVVARRLRALFQWSDETLGPGDGGWAVRRLLESVARKRATLLVVDDIHWADAELLDVITDLRERPISARLLVVCLARDELRESRPEWPVDVALGPLADADAMELVRELSGAALLPEEVRDRVAAAASGNALFAEQLVAYAVEAGAEAIQTTPPSLEALISSRLDRLPEAERGVLERAAVIGREFWRDAVAALSERDVDADVASLTSKRFVRAGRSTLAGEEALKFHHVLIRDVAYAAITKERRARMHERIARWLAEREPVADEVVGYHLEQAYLLGRELGRADEALAREAADHLAAAGMRAWMQAIAPAVVNLLGRATALLPPNDPKRIELLLELAGALRPAGEPDRALELLREAAAAASRLRDDRLRLRAELELVNAEAAVDAEASFGEIEACAHRAIPVFEKHGDERGLGRAWILLGDVVGACRGDMAAWEAAAERALAHYERARIPPVTPIYKLAAAIYHGPTPVPEAIERCEQFRRRTEGLQYAQATLLAFMGALHAQRRRFHDGRRLIADSTSLFEELGQHALVGSLCDPLLASLELLAEDWVAAERAAARACDRLKERPYRSTYLVRLGEALYEQGRLDDAREAAEEAATSEAPDDLITSALRRALTAKLLAPDDAEGAVETARAAVDALARSDALNARAHTVFALAIALAAAGNAHAAAAEAASALALYRRKGNVAAASRVRRLQ